jgi:Fic family protein
MDIQLVSRFSSSTGSYLMLSMSRLIERQLQILRRMLEDGPDGFEGGMSAQKYLTITGASQATATRDLQDLAEKGIFAPTGGGRSTHYQIRL